MVSFWENRAKDAKATLPTSRTILADLMREHEQGQLKESQEQDVALSSAKERIITAIDKEHRIAFTYCFVSRL